MLGGVIALCAGVTEGATASGAPQRIVSLVPSVTETVFALGRGAAVVGVSRYCDHPAAVADLPRVGTFNEPVAEAIAALRPDLILTTPTPGNESPVRALERAGLRVEVVQGDASVADVRASILAVAGFIAAGDAGQALMASIDAELAAVRERTRSAPPVSVAVVVGHDPLVLAGPASYLGEIVALAGGDNIAGALGGRWPRVGWEFLVASAPSVIIDVSMGDEGARDPAALTERWSRYPGIPAVASGRVFGHGADLLLRPGPRLGRAAAALAEMLHPPSRP